MRVGAELDTYGCSESLGRIELANPNRFSAGPKRERGPGVLQVITDSDRRGPQIFSQELGEALKSRGRTIRTVALREGKTSNLLPVRPLGRHPLGPRTQRDLHREIRASRAVIAYGSKTLMACAAAAVGSGVPLVFRSVGEPQYWANTFSRYLRTRWLYNRADIVVALWPGSADVLTNRFGVPPHRIRIIPRGVSAQRFPRLDPESRAAARRRLSIDSSTPTVAYLGALSPEKNIGSAIRAVGRIPEACLLVVGDGGERNGLQTLAGRVAPGRVFFLGPVSDPASILAAADVVVLPSHTEGIPGVLIEAGLMGLPIVATSVGGVGEIVADGVTGILVPPGDESALTTALRTTLRDPGTLGEQARQRCLDRFEISKVAASWDDLLHELGA